MLPADYKTINVDVNHQICIEFASTIRFRAALLQTHVDVNAPGFFVFASTSGASVLLLLTYVDAKLLVLHVFASYTYFRMSPGKT